MTYLKLAGILVTVIVLIVVGPFLTIWALNTLFNLSIAYTFWTWLAAMLLLSVFKARVGK